MKFSHSLFFCFLLFVNISIFAQSETEKGVELYRNGDFDGAITILENVVKTNQSDRKAWTYLGASFVKKEKGKDAANAFRKADSLTKKNPTEDELKEINEGLKITAKPRANYTDLARENNIQGTVKIAVEFLKDGKIGFISPVATLGGGLVEQCIYSARKIKFETAQKDGKSISVVKIISYSFTIY